MTNQRYRCPYPDCGFEGTEAQVDDHRTTGVHDDQPQAGSNLRAGTTVLEAVTAHHLRPVAGFEIRLAVEHDREAGPPTARAIHDVIADFIEQAPGATRLGSLSVVPVPRRDPSAQGSTTGQEVVTTPAERIEIVVDQAPGDECWVYGFRDGVGGFAPDHGIEVHMVDPGMFDHQDAASFEADVNEMVANASIACATVLSDRAHAYRTDHVVEQQRRQTEETPEDGR